MGAPPGAQQQLCCSGSGQGLSQCDYGDSFQCLCPSVSQNHSGTLQVSLQDMFPTSPLGWVLPVLS